MRRDLQNFVQPAQQRVENERYQVDVNLFAEVGVNWSTGANNRFADWYSQDLEK